MRRLARFGLVLVVATTLGGGCTCSRRDDDGTAPKGVQALPALSIRDDTPNLLLTWLDDRGDVHTELHPADVPAAGRSVVRVVVTDREEGTRDLFYVADLGVRGGDGSYATRTMPRRDWESLIDQRRRDYVAKNTPALPPGPPATGGPGTAPRPPVVGAQVIIYGASWCRPCHEAAEYLTSIGVAYVMKDVDKDEAAHQEMRQKLERVGRREGPIPVLDVRGEILVGFSKSDIDRALKRASSGTLL